jgi:hypothetical protein
MLRGFSSSSAVVVLGLLLACGGTSTGSRQFLSIGTGGTGGIYYPIGGAIASRLSARDSTRQYTAEVTGGSVENVNRLREGQIDLGFGLAVTVYEAYHGGLDYDAPFRNLRVVAPLYANLVHVLVPRGSSVESIGELAGARISVGAAGSGTEQVARQILEAYGLSPGDVEARYLTFSESAASLRDGAIDAAIISVGYPAAAVLEATTTGGARLLPLDPDRIEALKSEYPYYSSGVIPEGSYPGVNRAITTVAMMNWIVATEQLDPDVVETLLEVLRDDRRALGQVHEMAGQIDLAALAESPVPLHPQAEEWLAGIPARREH